jgi:hypothetical protein
MLVVRLHLGTLMRYEEQIRRLQASPTKGKEGDSEPAQAIRELIDMVTAHRDLSKPAGAEVVIAGRLNVPLGNDAFANGIKGPSEIW